MWLPPILGFYVLFALDHLGFLFLMIRLLVFQLEVIGLFYIFFCLDCATCSIEASFKCGSSWFFLFILGSIGLWFWNLLVNFAIIINVTDALLKTSKCCSLFLTKLRLADKYYVFRSFFLLWGVLDGSADHRIVVTISRLF